MSPQFLSLEEVLNRSVELEMRVLQIGDSLIFARFALLDESPVLGPA